MIIDDAKKKELLEAFKNIYENKESAKALNSSNSDLIKSLAESLQTNKRALNAAWKYWKELHESGEDPLDDIVQVFEAIKT